MRELYFRAWDIDVNEMVTLESHIEEYGISPDATHNKKLASFFERFFGCDVMQSTGLKDKNGVEIYEGDIVKTSIGIGVIEYIESYFRIFKPLVFSVVLCTYTSTNELEPTNDVEVIGNIHETPESLKKACLLLRIYRKLFSYF